MLRWTRGRSVLRPAPSQREDDMADSVYKVIQVVIDDENAIGFFFHGPILTAHRPPG